MNLAGFLNRYRANKALAGVCAGLETILTFKPNIVRL